MARLVQLLDRFVPLCLVLLGLILIVVACLAGWPSGPAQVKDFADTVLKALVVIVIGALLPKINSFEFGSAKVTLRDDTKTLSEAVNALSQRLNTLEAASRLGIEPLAEKASPGFAAPQLPPVRNPNDQQKGGFGSKASQDGYSISASFPDGSGAGNITRIVVEIRHDTSPLSAPVTLYLHETFSQSEVVVEPIDGVARMELLAWGGFTIGAWPQETPDVLLELDLSKLAHAPKVIREN